MWVSFISCILFLLIDFSCGEDQPLISTSLGKIVGQYKQSYGGRTFAAFEGIPFAKPPIGDLRFAEPQEIEPWAGTLNATTLYVCSQVAWQAENPVGDEDCLYLNVYIPKEKLNANENLDVIMFIHGGAFMMGSGSFGGPEYLMDRDIVYVSINYRLGPFGFLSTEDDVVSGNNGLKDQVAALKWIQKNIESFGGNPGSVTITGASAGGASAHFHYFSPLSKGLFHKGIAQSGTALAPWAIQDAPLESARKLAAAVGCNDTSTKDFINCMRQRPSKQILSALKEFIKFAGLPIAPFAPVIEKKSQTAFLTEYPYKLLENGNITQVPLIITITTDEGILGLMMVSRLLDQFNAEWNDVLPYVLEYDHTVNSADKVKVAEKIKEFYLNNKPVSQENLNAFVKLFGDRYFVYDFEKAVRMHAKLKKSSVYSYIYGYKGEFNFTQAFGVFEDYDGVGHAEDSCLIYYFNFGDIALITNRDNLSKNDEKIQNMLLDFFISFAKTGIPESKNIDWQPTDNSDNFNYLSIHKVDDIKMVSKEEIAPTEFWKSLPIKEFEHFNNV